MTIKIEPKKDDKLPYDLQDKEPESFVDELTTIANTQSFLEELGAPPEMSIEDAKKAASTLEQALKTQKTDALTTPSAAWAAKEFLKAYSGRLAFEMNDVRAALTNKLLELANCGDARFELKAIELLGKHSDIALFTERSEVTVNYKTSNDLEEAIKERVKRLLNATTIDVTPIDPTVLDDELGVAQPLPQKEEQTEANE